LFTQQKKQEKDSAQDNEFNLASAMNKAGTKYGLSFLEDQNEIEQLPKDYVNDPSNNLSNDLTDSLILANVYLDLNETIDSPKTRLEVVNNVYNDYRTLAKGKIYNENDLKLLKNETSQDLLTYNQNLGEIILNFQKQISTWNNQKDIAILINLYQEALSNLLALSVPESGKTELLNLINYFQKNIAYFKSLTTIQSDPIKYSLLAYNNNAARSSQELKSILISLENYFVKKGIK